MIRLETPRALNRIDIQNTEVRRNKSGPVRRKISLCGVTGLLGSPAGMPDEFLYPWPFPDEEMCSGQQMLR
jgi:hypothetical protein